ncbi:MAG TPA: ATP-binding protein [Nitrospira sp.]|nr:ATP-binding protein [Nitrospira sp.]
MNAQPVMVAVIDPASYVVQFQNETGLKQLGDLSGRTCYDSIAGCPTPCSFCKMPESVTTGRVTINEVQLPNNQHLLVQWSKAVTNDGRLHVIETITDVTAQKRLEEAAHKAEKMDALGRLAGGTAHDINNLLTVITGASELVSDETARCESTYDPIRQIQSAVNRAGELTRRLVAFSHRQVIQPCILDLNAVLGEWESQIRLLSGDGISVKLASSEDSKPVVADRRQIEQILSVLVSNARDAMPGGGSLTVSTIIVTIDDDKATEQGVKPGNYVRLGVRDTGCGIAPEMQGHLFEPYFTRTGEQTGRGLGLASVYGIVRQSGGFIEVASELNIGTVFNLYFPCSEQADHVRPNPALPSGSDGHITILLVEDDEDVRIAVSDMLKRAGYQVQEACDGIDALRQLQSMTSSPHLTLTDVMMPRMTGPQFVKQIQAFMPATKVLYMSGYTDQVLEPVGDQPLAFIPKPFSAKELIHKVRETLAK